MLSSGEDISQKMSLLRGHKRGSRLRENWIFYADMNEYAFCALREILYILTKKQRKVCQRGTVVGERWTYTVYTRVYFAERHLSFVGSHKIPESVGNIFGSLYS